MDIGLLQMTHRAPQPMKQTKVATTSNEKSFDKMLNQAVQSNAKTTEEKPLTEQEKVTQIVEEVQEVANSETLEEALDVLGVEHDDAMLLVIVEDEMIPVEEAMNLEDLAAMLNMTPEELQNIITKLTGEQVESTDVWAILEQTPQLLAQITAVLQGESQLVTPGEAGQLAKFLQLAQLVGQKQDTVYKQELTLSDVKQAIQLFTQQLAANTEQQNQGQEQPKQNFTQLMQQTQVASTQTAQNTEALEQTQVVSSQIANAQGAKTVSVALPMERPAQSEVLVKEIQNHLNRMQMANNNGVIKLTMRLFPENLGQIRIEVMQQDGAMQVRILATSTAGKELLDSSLNQLKTSLAAQNIQTDRIDIAQALQSSDAGRDQGLFNQFFRQQQQDVEEQKEETEDDEVSFEQLLEEQLQAEEV